MHLPIHLANQTYRKKFTNIFVRPMPSCRQDKRIESLGMWLDEPIITNEHYVINLDTDTKSEYMYRALYMIAIYRSLICGHHRDFPQYINNFLNTDSNAIMEFSLKIN